MSKENSPQRDPLEGTQIMSTVATGGAGGVFQSRVGALYLANMLTGLPTAFNLHGSRVEELRFEARYTGSHTDDIYCQLRSADGTHLQLIQCKRGLNASASNADFIDGLQGAWRDFLGIEGSSFNKSRDLLILATIAPASTANQAAKRLCELTRASTDLADFLSKLDTRKLFDRKYKDVWSAFKVISENTLAEKYTEELVFELLRCLRIDIHDVGTDSSQELSLVQALLTSDHPGDSGELVWDGLFAYVYEQGITVGTVTRDTWKQTAKTSLQDVVSRLRPRWDIGNIAERFSERARLQLSFLSTILPNGVHIPRGDCTARLLAGLENRQLAIVTGGPGAGKSAVIASLAPLLRESGPVFFFKADELDEPSLAAVQSLNGLPDPVLGMERFLRCGTPTVVIDSLEKALEARNPGALEELLALVRQNKGAKLCITTRSYALNPLYSNFLAGFSSQVVEIPLLTDTEISIAVANSALEDIAAKDAGVREVLRSPYYLGLALSYIAGGTALPDVSGNDLRRTLWTEHVAPSKNLPQSMAMRRQVAFDHVCYQRTERFSQFVEAPADAEAVASLLQDAVLVKDHTNRVAPAHDVLEDWSLFFRVELEVRSVERDWSALFTKLGSHAGMRRAVRTWTAQRSAEGDTDAYSMMHAALSPDTSIAQLWRDEVAVGLLRSDKVQELVVRLATNVSFDNASLLKRLGHLLRVACKGPTSIDYSHLAGDVANDELIARLGMAAPVGKAWDVIIALVAKAFPSLPPDSHSWVVELAEDAIAHDENWHQPSQRKLEVFNMAEYFCLLDNESWYREQSVGKRFYALLCSCCGADTPRFKAFIESIVQRMSCDSDRNAESRLEFLINFKNCREPSFFSPDLVRIAFWALYIESTPRAAGHFDMDSWEADLGISKRATHEFFPPSVLQGPFRSLLLYSFAKTVRFVVDLCNHSANSFAKTKPNEISLIPQEASPNGRPHIHDSRLWTAYRGHSVTSYVLNCALMALEERLLVEAEVQPEFISTVLEIILELGDSSFTTGLVAGVLIAQPKLVTEKTLSIFKCSKFFADDMLRCQQETRAFAIHGGNDGLDSERQKERLASNRLPHRQHNLERLALQLQLNRPDLRDQIFAILDKHLEDLESASELPNGWKIALKRMDARGLRLGKPEGNDNLVPLEIANLEPELEEASKRAQASLKRMNRLTNLRLWAGAITDRTSIPNPDKVKHFSSPTEPYDEFLQLRTEFNGHENAMLLGLEDELSCALIQQWPSDTSTPLQWARSYLLDVTSGPEEKDVWLHRSSLIGELRARTVILLASVDPHLPKMAEALATIITEPAWKVRWAASHAISDILRPKQPTMADVLTTALSQYAEELDISIERPRVRTHDIVDEARAVTVKALLEALREMKPGQRSITPSLTAVKEWTIALGAARSEKSDTWRVYTLTTLARLMADQEGKPKVDVHAPEHVDFDARYEMGDLFAAELLEQSSDKSPIFETFDYCLENAPELSERVLEATLSTCMNNEFENAEAFWRVWDRATAKILPHSSLRTKTRRSYSRFDKIVRVLLFCSISWPKSWHDLPLLRSRQGFVASCLNTAGDSRLALENLLTLMAGVGRTTGVPSALPQLRDAFGRAPEDLCDNRNCLWQAETICRVAVHEHRDALIRDVILRKATLDILDRLVEAGSSLAFQLRDYLAASSSERAQQVTSHSTIKT